MAHVDALSDRGEHRVRIYGYTGTRNMGLSPYCLALRETFDGTVTPVVMPSK